MILRPRSVHVVAAIASLALLASSGCECGPRRPARAERRVPLPLEILADRGAGGPLARGAPDTARAWLAQVSTSPPPARVAPPPASLAPPLPAVGFDSLRAAPEPEPAGEPATDDELKPPIPRAAAPLRLPRSVGRPERLELDVRIDERGEVSDALWAGGSRDSAAVSAAIECALGMRFFPALRSGRPVAVWCRQTFEFGRGVAWPVKTNEPAGPADDR